MVFKTNTIKISATTKVINYSVFNEHILTLFQPTGSQQLNLFDCASKLFGPPITLPYIMRSETASPKNTRYLYGRQAIPGVHEIHNVFAK